MKLEELDKTVVSSTLPVIAPKQVDDDWGEEPAIGVHLPARLLPFHLQGYNQMFPHSHAPTVPCARELKDPYHVALVEDEENPGRVRYVKMFADGHLGGVED